MAPGRVAVVDAATHAVTNIILLDLDDKRLGNDKTLQVIPADVAVDIGDAYDYATGTFLSGAVRDVETVRREKLALLADALAAAQDAGMVYDGHRFATDNDSQVKFMGIIIGAMMDPAYSVEFKTVDKTYIQLDHDQVVKLCLAVKAHVTACFQNDQRLTGEIQKAATIEDLDAIDAAKGWP